MATNLFVAPANFVCSIPLRSMHLANNTLTAVEVLAYSVPLSSRPFDIRELVKVLSVDPFLAPSVVPIISYLCAFIEHSQLTVTAPFVAIEITGSATRLHDH